MKPQSKKVPNVAPHMFGVGVATARAPWRLVALFASEAEAIEAAKRCSPVPGGFVSAVQILPPGANGGARHRLLWPVHAAATLPLGTAPDGQGKPPDGRGKP